MVKDYEFAEAFSRAVAKILNKNIENPHGVRRIINGEYTTGLRHSINGLNENH